MAYSSLNQRLKGRLDASAPLVLGYKIPLHRLIALSDWLG